jgi:tetratricopeptide (TPR) repeat protein
VIRTKLGEYEIALQDFGLAVIIKPDYSEAYSNRGITYVHLQDVDMGMSNFMRALELDPTNVDAYYNRALTYRILGDNRAADDFRKVLELSRDPEIRRVAADYLQEQE